MTITNGTERPVPAEAVGITGPVEPADLLHEPGEPGLKAGFHERGETEPGPGTDGKPINPPETKPAIPERLEAARTVRRKPVIPVWLASREARKAAAKVTGSLAVHKTAYHGVRVGWYGGKVAAYAARGVLRVGSGTVRMVVDTEGRPLREHAIESKDIKGYAFLVRERNARVARRSLGVAASIVGALIAWGLLLAFAPHWLSYGVLTCLMLALARAGKPAGQPIIGPAVRKSAAPRLTDATIALALASLGIGPLAKMHKEGKTADLFTGQIERIGHGWRTEINLPHGVTAAEIAEVRPKLASGLRRQIGAVWPMEMKHLHPGALELLVLDKPFSELAQPAWPLARKGTGDMIGGTIPFGWDQRGQLIRFGLFENNMVIGAAPGQGKTGAVLVVACTAALDPNCELHYYELKGTGDGSGLRPICHRYVSSAPTPEAIEEIMDGLREVHSYLDSRAAAISRAGSAFAPDSKVTCDLAADPKRGLHPIVVIIDECQELYQSDQGEEAKQLTTTILKRGRALGIILVLSTQNPDADSLPKAADRLVMTRYCLRVNDWQANNMTLGSGAYAAGHRATLFDESDKGVGLLKTGGTTVRTVRTAWLNRATVEAIGQRALALRTDGGRLTGDAVGQAVENQADRLTVVADTLTVARKCPGTDRESAWLHEIEQALSDFRPGMYGDLEPEWLGARLRALGIPTIEQRNRRINGEQINRAGVTLGALRKILEG